MKNGLSLRQQQLQVIMYYIITCHEHFMRTLADKTNAPPKNEQYFFFFHSKRYRDFSETTILKRLLSNGYCVPQSISYY